MNKYKLQHFEGSAFLCAYFNKRLNFIAVFFQNLRISPYFCSPFMDGAVSATAEKDRNANGAVAQSVEQRTENPCVGGSIPPHTTKKPLMKIGGFLFYI